MLCAAEQTGNQVLVIPHTHWEGAEIRKLLAEGRLAIAGGTDTMHDNNIPSGESIVRQYLYGKTYFREKLG